MKSFILLALFCVIAPLVFAGLFQTRKPNPSSYHEISVIGWDDSKNEFIIHNAWGVIKK